MLGMRVLMDVRGSRRFGVGAMRPRLVREESFGGGNLPASIETRNLVQAVRQAKRALLLACNSLYRVKRVVAAAIAGVSTGVAHAY